MIRIGHKGAHTLVPGNTIASFERAVEVGVDLIEIDVLWTPSGHPSLPAGERSPLLIAHDWQDAASRTPHTLDEALDAFTRPPLEQVELNLDIKLPGREPEIVDAIRNHGLIERAMVSGMDLPVIDRVARLNSGLRLGWTVPKVRRRSDRIWTVRPLLDLALARLRWRLPAIARRQLAGRGVFALWAHHAVISRPLVEAAGEHGVKVFAWTVDDPARIAVMRKLGVAGICSNDPRLLSRN